MSRERRQNRVRARMRGNEVRPRLSVFRSMRHLSAQLIDDTKGITIVSASDLELSKKDQKLKGKERASWVGARLAEKAKEKNVSAARFDRGQYRYHGLIQALAEGARKGGLQF